MKEVTIDDLFKWGDSLALKAKQTFGTHQLAVSAKTFADAKERCFRIDVDSSSYLYPPRVHLNTVHLHIIEGMPDGIVRGLNREGTVTSGARLAPCPAALPAPES